MKASLRLSLAIAAVLSMLLIAVPASADSNHATMNFDCPNPSPNTAGSASDARCTWVFPDDFGNTDNDKITKFEIQLPVDATINRDENSTVPDGSDDPDDGKQVGTVTVATDLNYDGCGDNNDGGTYKINWEDTWTAFTVPAGYTKVAEFDTVFTVLFFFTDHVATHVIRNNTTMQYIAVTDIPEGRGCTGADPTFDQTIWSNEENNSAFEWVGKNPTTNGCYTVKIVATEVGGTVHDDSDWIRIGAGGACP